MPQVTEVAFGVLGDRDRPRKLIVGINWSSSWVNPFRTLGGPGGLDSLLTDRRFGPEQPVVLLLHVAHPRVVYSDRGKSSVVAS